MDSLIMNTVHNVVKGKPELYAKIEIITIAMIL